jgi:hypothetical protein
MEVEMARSETEAVAGCDRSQILQSAGLERESLDSAGVFCLVRRGVVAARHQQDAAVGWRCENLMRIDAGIEIGGLGDRRADRAVGIEPMDGQAARIVVGDQQISAARVGADMNGTRRQRGRVAMRTQRARCRIDGQRIGAMFVAGDARAAVTGNGVKGVARRMRPDILDIGGQRDGAALGQCGAFDVDIEKAQDRSDARVIHRPRVIGSHGFSVWNFCLERFLGICACGACADFRRAFARAGFP